MNRKELIGRRVRISPDSKYIKQNKGLGTITKFVNQLNDWVTVVFDDGYSNSYQPDIDLIFINMVEQGSRF